MIMGSFVLMLVAGEYGQDNTTQTTIRRKKKGETAGKSDPVVDHFLGRPVVTQSRARHGLGRRLECGFPPSRSRLVFLGVLRCPFDASAYRFLGECFRSIFFLVLVWFVPCFKVNSKCLSSNKSAQITTTCHSFSSMT